MKFVPILDGIEYVLQHDADTKDVIKDYKRFMLEEGVSSANIPFCFIPRVAAPLKVSGLGPGYSRIRAPHIYVMLLGQAYSVPARHAAMIGTLDTLQHNADDAFAQNRTLNNSVLDCKVATISSVADILGTYFGFMLDLEIIAKVDVAT
jgi:hypothetical protein